MKNKIDGFQAPAKDIRDDYNARALYFSQSLLEELSLMSVEDGNKLIEKMGFLLCKALEEKF